MAALEGMKEIRQYLNNKSEVTVLKLIREESFPAVKMLGTWVTTTEKIEEWWEQRIGEKLRQKPQQKTEVSGAGSKRD